jgi:hypothetical protein
MPPRYQRQLLNEYIPLFSALFPPGKFDTANLKQWLIQSFNNGISYFNDNAAAAVISALDHQ